MRQAAAATAARPAGACPAACLRRLQQELLLHPLVLHPLHSSVCNSVRRGLTQISAEPGGAPRAPRAPPPPPRPPLIPRWGPPANGCRRPSWPSCLPGASLLASRLANAPPLHMLVQTKGGWSVESLRPEQRLPGMLRAQLMLSRGTWGKKTACVRPSRPVGSRVGP